MAQHPTKTKIKGKLKVPPQLKEVYPDSRGIVEFMNKEHDISYGTVLCTCTWSVV